MVQKTTNYGMFKILKANRELNQGHLARLTVSISKRNMLEQNPIIVNENMEIIDGQHRLEVAKANHLPIWYTIVPDAGIDEVLEMNTNLRTWKLVDFIDSLIIRGFKEMAYIKEFAEDYGLSLTNAIILHTGGKINTKGNPSVFLSKQVFSPAQREIAKRAGDLCTVIRSHSNRKGMFPVAVVQVCRDLALEKKDKEIADAIQTRGKIVAISNDQHEMRRILDGYVRGNALGAKFA